MIALAMALALVAPPQGEDQAKRFATIERLQTAGQNAGGSIVCEMAGYQIDEEGRGAYIRQEVGYAQADGMFDEQAYSYLKTGMSGRTETDLATMRRLTQLRQAGDPAAVAKIRAFVTEVVDRCDLLASRSETRDMFSYVPPNAVVASRIALKGLGLAK